MSTHLPDITLILHPEVVFANFVAEHQVRAVRMAWRLSGSDQATAEEIAQDAFLKAQAQLSQLRDLKAMRSWFYKILARQATSYHRWATVRKNAARWLPLFAPEPPALPDPTLREQIHLAMQNLSPGQREVFTLFL